MASQATNSSIRRVGSSWPVLWLLWALVTTLGWLGVAGTTVIIGFRSGIWRPEEVTSYLSRPPATRLISSLIIGAIIGLAFGALFGAFQWKALRHTRQYAALTVIVTVIGTIVLCVASSTGPVQVRGDLSILGRALLTGGILGGVFSGLCQWLLLRRRLPGVDRWPLITTIGWVVSWIILSWSLDIHLDGTSDSKPLMLAVIPPAAGAIAGLFQWLLLRRKLPQAGWWIVATAASWALPFWVVQIPGARLVHGLMLAGIFPATAIVLLLRQLEPYSTLEKQEHG